MDYGALVLTARRTGIGPRTRQSAFEGSRRQLRARLLRVVLGAGPLLLSDLAAELGRPPQEVAELVDLLARDGLLRRSGDLVEVA
jgi:A/G-specific adenine glycosylase